MARINVLSEVTGKVWKIESEVGTTVSPDEAILIIESMKMEIPASSVEGGTVVELLVQKGDAVQEGQVVAIVES